MICTPRYLIPFFLVPFFTVILLAAPTAAAPGDDSPGDLPSAFDLRNANGENFVTPVKSQQGGTCWTFGAMAAVESNLLMTGRWVAAGEIGWPDMAEYHLDWWNGFNRHNNDDTDPPTGGGLTVHMGGDYMVTSAYLSRGEGAVRNKDGQSYIEPPLRMDPSYHYYYPRHIEWHVAGQNLVNLDTIKEKIMTEGAVGTCMCSNGAFISGTVHYQPPSTTQDPNHAIAIIGWDDNKNTQAPKNGAWLCKNSWGKDWGNAGFFWISYYDKHCGQHPQMGAISYQQVEPMVYQEVYYHDYHGWRDTKSDVTEAFNAFVARHIGEDLRSVNFFTAADNVTYTVQVFDRFEGGELLDELAVKSGVFDHVGLHTVDLDAPIRFSPGEDFYVYLYLSEGGHPFDRTSEVPVLLGADDRVLVESSAGPGESYYYSAGAWHDLYEFNDTANFCIKGLSTVEPTLDMALAAGLPESPHPIGLGATLTLEIKAGVQHYVPGTAKLHYRYDPAAPFTEVSMTPLGGDLYEGLLPPTKPGDQPVCYFSAQGDGGATVTFPFDAPDNVFSFSIGLEVMIMADDFEQDLGWFVWNIDLSDGEWERGDPEGTSAQPEDDHSPTGSQCFVTGKAGGSSGDNDVDGGPTYLYSPPIDCSDGDAVITFHVWSYHSTTGKQQPLYVSVANNGLSFTKVMEIGHSPEWKAYSFKVSKYVEPTDQVQVQFRSWDNPNDSIVEALVDDFEVVKVLKAPSLWADAYTLTCGTGGTVNFGLDAGSDRANRAYLMLGSLSGHLPGYALPGGEILPLNLDAFTNLLIGYLWTPACQGFYGVLDGEGTATATLRTFGPVDPVLVGEFASFAYLLIAPPAYDFVSNPINLLFD